MFAPYPNPPLAEVRGAIRSEFPTRETTGTVKYGPYLSIPTDAANYGDTTGKTSKGVFNQSNFCRMAQYGAVTRVRFGVADLTGLTGFYITIWRDTSPASTNYARIQRTPNLRSQLAVGLNDLQLASPLEVWEGDLVSYRLEWTGGATVNNLCALTGVSSAFSRTSINGDSSSLVGTLFAWGSMASVTGTIFPIECYGAPPRAVWYGDSNMAGNGAGTGDPSHSPQRTASGSFNPLNSRPRQLSLLFGGPQRCPYQNMALSGMRSYDDLPYFQANVIDKQPAVAFLGYGTNNIVLDANPNKVRWKADMRAMIEGCLDNQIIPVCPNILPYSPTPYTNPVYIARQALIAEWNAEYEALKASYGTDDQGRPLVVHVDLAPVVCVAGSRTIINPDYTMDGIHFYRNAKILMAAEEARALQAARYARYAS